MAIFSPDFVAPGDDIGFGQWLNSHFLEHQQFVQRGLANTPVVFIPEYDLLAWDRHDEFSQRIWLETHETIHDILRATTGVQGLDLALIDWQDPSSVLFWMDAHAFEHAQIRSVLGIV